jgi:hypothetical protein
LGGQHAYAFNEVYYAGCTRACRAPYRRGIRSGCAERRVTRCIREAALSDAAERSPAHVAIQLILSCARRGSYVGGALRRFDSIREIPPGGATGEYWKAA